MSHKTRFISIILVLAATVALVAVLSAVTQSSPRAAADHYIEQLRAQQQSAQGLSAPVEGQQGISLVAGLTGVLGILVIPVTGWLTMAKARRDRQRAQERRRARKEQRAGAAGLKYRV